MLVRTGTYTVQCKAPDRTLRHQISIQCASALSQHHYLINPAKIYTRLNVTRHFHLNYLSLMACPFTALFATLHSMHFIVCRYGGDGN
jgi:hypothetical protein